ncbi:MAG: tyrosine-type recombinase/integrase [Pseudomonadota bacterium]
MAKTVFDNGIIIVCARYILQKPDGSLFYQRRVPKGLEKHHGGKSLIRESLQTKSAHVAAKRAAKLAIEHDALWRSLRDPDLKDAGLTTTETRDGARALLASLGLIPGSGHEEDGAAGAAFEDYLLSRYGEDFEEARHGRHAGQENVDRLLSPVEREVSRLLFAKPGEKRHLLSEARDLYLEMHRRGEQQRFKADTTRAVQHVIDAIGDLPLTLYTRKHARGVVAVLEAQGNKTATVRRRLRTINAVFNKAIVEFELRDATNPFEKQEIRGEGDDATERQPFTKKELIAIAKGCRKADDDIRHIVAMQLDTGARAGEIIGLRIEDVFLDAKVPHVWIRAHPALGRTLKTRNSERKVPLVGVALWAAKRAIGGAGKARGWLFPRYASDGDIRATHASNTVNKWLKATTKSEKTSHSFRHAMRDRLRAVRAPDDVQNEIGGWGTRTVGQGYGEGYSLEAKSEYLTKVVF